MLNIWITILLSAYIVELGRQINQAFRNITLAPLPMMAIVGWVSLIITTIFFVWDCVVIYQILFDMQPTTYNQVQQLIICGLIDTAVDIWATKNGHML